MGDLVTCLTDLDFSSEDAVEIREIAKQTGGDAEGVQAYMEGLTADKEDLRQQLADQGAEVATVSPAEQLGIEEPENPEEVQIASAASKFLRTLLKDDGGLRALKDTPKGTHARMVNEMVEGNYAGYADDVPTEGVDFNFDNLDTSDEVKKQLNAFSKNYEGKIDDAKKGVITHETTKQIADLLGTTPERAAFAVKDLPGDVEDLHVRALTMRNMLVSSGERIDRAAATIQIGGPDVTDADYLEFRRDIARHSQLVAQFKGVQTEIGRALSAFRIPAGTPPIRSAAITEERLDALGGRGVARDIADKWLKTPIDRRANFAQKTVLANIRDTVLEVWINGLLSGLRTHEVNTVGNASFNAWQILERGVAAGIGGVTRNPDRVRVQEVWAMIRAYGEGSKDGVRMAWQSWKDEAPASGLGKLEGAEIQSIAPQQYGIDPASSMGKAVDYIGQGIRLPGRALITGDEYFKALAYRQELAATTERKMLNARDRGQLGEIAVELSMRGNLSPEDARAATRLRRVSETRTLNQREYLELRELSMNNPTPDIIENAKDYGHMVTFTTELGEFGQSLQHLIKSDKTGMLRTAMPFVRTPVNLLKMHAQRNPMLAVMMPTVWRDLSAGGARRDLAIARIGVGSAVASWATTMAMDGNLTGSGPSDPGKRKHWLETHKPHSVRIGDTWVPVGRLDPLSYTLGTVAQVHDYIRFSSDEESDQNLAVLATAAIVENLGDKVYLQGLANFAAAYDDPGRYMERYLANLGASMVPYSSFLRDVGTSIDPTKRETRPDPGEKNVVDATVQRYINELEARYPGFGTPGLEARKNFWGEDLQAYDGEWYQAFNAFRTYKIKESPIDDELVRLNQPLSMPNPQIGAQKLSWPQYAELMNLMNAPSDDLISDAVDISDTYVGGTMRSYMNWLVTSEAYQALTSNEAKATHLVSVRNDFADAARAKLAEEDPTVGEALEEFEYQRELLNEDVEELKDVGTDFDGSYTPPAVGRQPEIE